MNIRRFVQMENQIAENTAEIAKLKKKTSRSHKAKKAADKKADKK